MGGSALPSNVRIVIRTWGLGPAEAAGGYLVREVVSGLDVPVTEEIIQPYSEMGVVVLLTPTAPYAPGVSYQVLSRNDGGFMPGPARTFSVGQGQDLTPPTAPDLWLRVFREDAGALDSCDGHPVRAYLEGDAGEERLFEISSDGGVFVAFDDRREGRAFCGSGVPFAMIHWLIPGDVGAVEVRSVDLAGNFSPAVTVPVAALCGARDGGATPVVDAGLADGGVTSPADAGVVDAGSAPALDAGADGGAAAGASTSTDAGAGQVGGFETAGGGCAAADGGLLLGLLGVVFALRGPRRRP